MGFQESYTRAETGAFYGQTTGAANGSSGSPVSPTMSSYSESSVTTTDARPHIKYVRAPPSSLTSVGSGSSANQAAFLTMTSPGVFGILSQVLAPGTSMAGVRVIAAAEGSASSLQSMVTVYPTSTSASKSNDEISSSLINGSGSGGGGGGFCIPAGVVIPNLVTLPLETSNSVTITSSSYDTSKNQPQISHLKQTSGVPTNSTVLSLPNGLLKATVNRSLQPSTSSVNLFDARVTQVITPITVTRSLPLVTQMAVMQPAKHVAHVITASSVDKVPILKSGSIPIIGGQYLTSSAARQVIKPVVVVATSSPSPSPTPATTREVVARPLTPQLKNPPP